jgi:hypothetical protein
LRRLGADGAVGLEGFDLGEGAVEIALHGAAVAGELVDVVQVPFGGVEQGALGEADAAQVPGGVDDLFAELVLEGAGGFQLRPESGAEFFASSGESVGNWVAQGSG